MNYNLGGKITTKKPHACGCYNWTITRVGADIKLKCDSCGRAIFVSIDKLEKMCKSYSSGEVDGKF